MISYNDAKQLVIEQAHSFGTEKVLLDDALGRVIAEKVFADRAYPPFNRSSMDGIAIKISDWEKGIRQFEIKETIYAGKTPQSTIASEECYKIMTGAAVPLDADSVIRREDCHQTDNNITVDDIEVIKGQNISTKGEDLKVGEIIIDQSIKCNTAVIAALASVGKYEVLVECLPKVAVITTGDEVINVDKTPTDVQIRNSNASVLRSLLRKWQITPVACEHVVDDKVKLEEVISNNMSNDILILNGGVSAGDADYVPGILAELGAKQIFHKVAIKPGKPIWFGKFDNGAIVFALPGNPFSCMVTFKLFIELFLTVSFGLTIPNNKQLPFNGTRNKKSVLDEFFPVQIIGSPLALVPMQFNGSGDITAALLADAIAQHPADKLVLMSGDLLNYVDL
ncbi:molybdopterin molybdotransferase MoeA [Ferruginibacter lapsinanis]|uniref:molybdopterin molybdotransferase MoeA n=1 Tax=Ferruginibacter lapsinanis TaxID=563172 RepID=UPI001E4FC6F2|nr:molybdopterin molybdotransferase MoeA [Ferruginibacter lapsinanis]UEG50112.1 molybdopterin molybdotransferase MoeA [Ferruginibacter lapsinanis]